MISKRPIEIELVLRGTISDLESGPNFSVARLRPNIETAVYFDDGTRQRVLDPSYMLGIEDEALTLLSIRMAEVSKRLANSSNNKIF